VTKIFVKRPTRNPIDQIKPGPSHRALRYVLLIHVLRNGVGGLEFRQALGDWQGVPSFTFLHGGSVVFIGLVTMLLTFLHFAFLIIIILNCFLGNFCFGQGISIIEITLHSRISLIRRRKLKNVSPDSGFVGIMDGRLFNRTRRVRRVYERWL